MGFNVKYEPHFVNACGFNFNMKTFNSPLSKRKPKRGNENSKNFSEYTRTLVHININATSHIEMYLRGNLQSIQMSLKNKLNVSSYFIFFIKLDKCRRCL